MKPSSLLLVALVFAADAEGATVGHVPSQFATIQAAIDAPRDTVYVHGDATYEENVHITLSFVPELGGQRSLPRHSTSAQHIDRVAGERECHREGIPHPGRCIGGGNGRRDVRVRLCRADGGLTCSAPQSYAYVTGCIVFGNLVVSGIFARSLMNTVSGGGMSGGGEATSPFQCNLVIGPAAVGINLGADDFILDNVDCAIAPTESTSLARLPWVLLSTSSRTAPARNRRGGVGAQPMPSSRTTRCAAAASRAWSLLASA